MGIHEVQSDNAPSNIYLAQSHSGRSQHFSCTHSSVTALLLSSQFGHSTSLVLTIRSQHFYSPHTSQHFSYPQNSVIAFLFVLTIWSQHFSCPYNSVTALLLSLQFGHSTSLCPYNSITALLFVLKIRSQYFSLSSQFGHNTSLILTIRSQHISFLHS